MKPYKNDIKSGKKKETTPPPTNPGSPMQKVTPSMPQSKSPKMQESWQQEVTKKPQESWRQELKKEPQVKESWRQELKKEPRMIEQWDQELKKQKPRKEILPIRKPSNPMLEPKKPSDYINQPPSLPKPPQRGMPTESPYTEGKPIKKRLPQKRRRNTVTETELVPPRKGPRLPDSTPPAKRPQMLDTGMSKPASPPKERGGYKLK